MTKYVKTNTCTWDKALTFPMKYRDCPQDTEFLFTVYGIYSPSHIFVVGGTRISLYSSKRKTRSGGYHLRMYLHKKGKQVYDNNLVGKLEEGCELSRLDKRMRNYRYELRKGRRKRIDLLDTRIERIIYEKFHEHCCEKKTLVFQLEFPTFTKQILNKTGETTKIPYTVYYQEKLLKEPIPPLDVLQFENSTSHAAIWDPEMNRDNPVELKNRKLSPEKRSWFDRNLKPNSEELFILEEIIAQPPTLQLKDDYKNLLWKYRYFLTKYKKSLTKFLKCVDWNDKN